jgi:DNA polymerase III alpha subunit
VDVKRASTNSRLALLVAEGSIRRAVPMEMRMVNPMIEIRAGDWKIALEMRIVRFLYGVLVYILDQPGLNSYFVSLLI